MGRQFDDDAAGAESGAGRGVTARVGVVAQGGEEVVQRYRGVGSPLAVVQGPYDCC